MALFAKKALFVSGLAASLVVYNSVSSQIPYFNMVGQVSSRMPDRSDTP